MKTLIILLLSICLSVNCQEVKYAAYNCLSAGLIGGVGAGINKHKGQSFTGAFKKGFVKGLIGGTVNYSSKYILYLQNPSKSLDWKIFWSSKIINSFSNTLIYNAVQNNDDWIDNYFINIGFLRFSVNNIIQIDALSLGSMAYIFSTGAKLNIQKTLNIGIPYFDYKWQYIKTEKGSHAKRYGYALGQNIVIQTNISNSTTIHEIIHTYQRSQYSALTNVKIKKISKFINLDISLFDPIYLLQNKTIGYKNNIFEQESRFFEK